METAPQTQTQTGRRHTLLVVEDEPNDLLIVEQMLRHMFDLRMATTLGDAIRSLQANQPDAILLDLQLPDSRFPDTLQRVLAYSGNSAIVIVSGNGDDEFVRRCIESGADGYLYKNRLRHLDIVAEINHALTNNAIERKYRTLVERSRGQSQSEGIQGPS